MQKIYAPQMLYLKIVDGLKVAHAKDLCPTNVISFYTNIIEVYKAIHLLTNLTNLESM